MTIGQRLQEGNVVDHREGRRERAQVVFLPERVDAVLDAHGRVVLGKNGRRDADESDAPVRGGRGVACRVEHRAAADGHDVRVAAQTSLVDRVVDVVHVARVVLHRLAAWDDEDGPRQAQHRAVTAGVLGYLVGQVRMVIDDALIDDDDEA